MIDGLVAGVSLAGLPVDAAFVRAQMGSLVNTILKDRAKVCSSNLGDVTRADAPVALNQRDDSFLRSRCFVCAIARLAAHETFVAFHELAFAAELSRVGIGHRLANAVRHEPSRLVG